MFDFVTGFIASTGYLGIAFLMFAENVFPPIPSEIIMPLAGFEARAGELNIVLVLLAGSLGSLAGALFWYYVGIWIGIDRLKRWARKHGRLLTLTPGDIDKGDRWFDRYGQWAVFFGRLVPTVRTFISVPAGISDMRFGVFLLFTAAGTIIWTAFLTLMGYWLGGNYEAVSAYMGPVSNTVVALIVGYYLYRVATFRKKVAKEDRPRR